MSKLIESVKETVIKVLDNPMQANPPERLFVYLLGVCCPKDVEEIVKEK